MYDIGFRRELFVDDRLIDRMEGLSLKLHSPDRREVALSLNASWEGPYSHYVTVFQDEDKYRMYYRGWQNAESRAFTCLAESDDGVHWQKPNLGIVDFEGSKDNNIVWKGPGAHNFAPFKDSKPGVRHEERYKALADDLERPGKGRTGLRAIASPDGLNWHLMKEEPVMTEGKFDSQNLAFWDSEQNLYIAYIRDSKGFRSIRRCTSEDYLIWSDPEWLDFGAAPDEHLYTNATIPYFRAPHFYLAFPKRYVKERNLTPLPTTDEQPNGVSDGVFMSSRDGLHWDRRFMEAFLRPGRDRECWMDRNNGIAWGMLATAADEISLYWIEHYRYPSCRVRRGTLRMDGFVSVNAGYGGGEMVTKPFTFSGDRLSLNYATSAVGRVQVEIQDPDGRPVKGFELCLEMYGDEIDAVVGWPVGSDLKKLADRQIRLRFVLKDADIYSMVFRRK